MHQLTFQYPSWYLILCIALGLAYAGLLYFRSAAFREQPPYARFGLTALRFLAVTGIAILLLEPIIKLLQTETRKPVVVIAQDASESVGASLGEAGKAKYRESMENLAAQLGDKFDVATFSFGEDFREGLDFDFKDKSSNLSQALRGIYDLYSNQNLGAVILAKKRV